MGSRLWFALWRPGGKEPEPGGIDVDKSDLWSLALRRSGMHNGGKHPTTGHRMLWAKDGLERITRNAGIHRLKAKGWRLERLPERFWEKARRWEDLQEKEAAFDRAIRRSLGL